MTHCLDVFVEGLRLALGVGNAEKTESCMIVGVAHTKILYSIFLIGDTNIAASNSFHNRWHFSLVGLIGSLGVHKERLVDKRIDSFVLMHMGS